MRQQVRFQAGVGLAATAALLMVATDAAVSAPITLLIASIALAATPRPSP